ncbi:HNH endonuclease [Variovorax sp. RB2P76]|uniref:HNH endonuclease n=1 Tax=Variovorax sp. RB2P76 TaxID=3443736 RepID=UPI003F47CDE7
MKAISRFDRIQFVTDGERLFSDLNKIAQRDLRAAPFSEHPFPRVTGRPRSFGRYAEGSAVAFAFKRILKAAHGIFHDPSIDPTSGNKQLMRVIGDWFDWLDKAEVASLMRATLRAHDASSKPISKSVQALVFGVKRRCKCCFCGGLLERAEDEKFYDAAGKKATLEHVWPASLGGNSIGENLVPACYSCNQAKADVFTWEQANIHDFVYPINFQLSEFRQRVPLHQKIVLQRRAVMDLAIRDSLTLKKSLIAIGPFGDIEVLDSSDTWDFFNTQNHYENSGEHLW